MKKNKPYKRQKKKLALELGIQTYQILTNDDEVYIPSLSSIFSAVTAIFKWIKIHELHERVGSNQQQLVMHYKITLLLVRVFAHVVASGFPVKMRPRRFCSCIGIFRLFLNLRQHFLGDQFWQNIECLEVISRNPFSPYEKNYL